MKKRYIIPNTDISKVSTLSLCDTVVSPGDPTDDFGSKRRRETFDEEEIEEVKWEYGTLW